MNHEKRGNCLILKSILTDSNIRLERQQGGVLCVSIASRDNAGMMHIESAHVPLQDIQELPEGELANYRSPTAEERNPQHATKSP